MVVVDAQDLVLMERLIAQSAEAPHLIVFVMMALITYHQIKKHQIKSVLDLSLS